MARLSVALVHGPVLDRHGAEQTTALTNLDIHDLARSARTYGCTAFYVITPVAAQQEQARTVVGFWEGEAGRRRNQTRAEALSVVHVVASLDDAVAAEAAALGRQPVLVATSARPQGTTAYPAFRQQLDDDDDGGALILFGTGAGLTQAMLDRCAVVLAPLVGPEDRSGRRFNHLSVRSAAAIILDRLRGA
jgi:hypothetical protein